MTAIFVAQRSFGARYRKQCLPYLNPLSGAVSPIMPCSDGSFCLPVFVTFLWLLFVRVNVVVYLSGAVPLIFHLNGGTTYRGQCFPRVFILIFIFFLLCFILIVCVLVALVVEFFFLEVPIMFEPRIGNLLLRSLHSLPFKLVTIQTVDWIKKIKLKITVKSKLKQGLQKIPLITSGEGLTCLHHPAILTKIKYGS